MTGAWPGIAGFLAAMAALAGGLRVWQRLAAPPPELPRKLMHIGTGLLVLAFPWLFHERWPVLLLAGASIAAMLALRLVPALREGTGQVLHAVRRESLGDLCFPLSVAILFVLARGDRLLFVIPMLVLTLADATAALIGVKYGRNRYRSAEGKKSFEGSFAFFAVAFASVWVPLRLGSPLPPDVVTLASALIGLLVMLIEAASWRGLDNLFTPLLTAALVVVFRRLTEGELLLRLGALGCIAVLIFAFRRRTRLDTGALLGVVLFFYICWALGGWAWLVAPLTFFCLHALLWPRGRRELPQYDGRTIFSLALPGCVLLLSHTLGTPTENGVAYATALALVGADRQPGARLLRARLLRGLLWSVAAYLVACLPAHCAFAGKLAMPPPAALLAIAAGALLYPVIDALRPLEPPWTHRTTALCALAAAALARVLVN